MRWVGLIHISVWHTTTNMYQQLSESCPCASTSINYRPLSISCQWTFLQWPLAFGGLDRGLRQDSPGVDGRERNVVIDSEYSLFQCFQLHFSHYFVSVCGFDTTCKVLLMKNILHLQWVSHRDSCNLICAVSIFVIFCPSTVVFRNDHCRPAAGVAWGKFSDDIQRTGWSNTWSVRKYSKQSTTWQVLSPAPLSNDFSLTGRNCMCRHQRTRTWQTMWRCMLSAQEVVGFLRLRVTNDYRAEFSKPEDCKKRLKGSWISTVKVKLIDLVESCQLQHIWLRQQATSKVYWPAYESPSSTPTPKSFLVAWGTSKLCSYTWTPRLRLVSCILLKWMAWHYDSQRWRFSLNTLDLWCR